VTSVRRVTKNTLANVASYSVGLLLQVVLTGMVARSLGVETYGAYAVIIATVGVFEIVSDFGLRTIIVREIAR